MKKILWLTVPLAVIGFIVAVVLAYIAAWTSNDRVWAIFTVTGIVTGILALLSAAIVDVSNR